MACQTLEGISTKPELNVSDEERKTIRGEKAAGNFHPAPTHPPDTRTFSLWKIRPDSEIRKTDFVVYENCTDSCKREPQHPPWAPGDDDVSVDTDGNREALWCRLGAQSSSLYFPLNLTVNIKLL